MIASRSRACHAASQASACARMSKGRSCLPSLERPEANDVEHAIVRAGAYRAWIWGQVTPVSCSETVQRRAAAGASEAALDREQGAGAPRAPPSLVGPTKVLPGRGAVAA